MGQFVCSMLLLLLLLYDWSRVVNVVVVNINNSLMRIAVPLFVILLLLLKINNIN